MSTVINTNLASLFAQNSLSNAQNNLATSVQRLSSGLRINSAKDDAAGLAIAQNMQSQLNGTNQSIQNLSNATNLLQTADTSLSTIQDMLLRMKQLATQGYDGSLNATQMQDVVQQMSQLRTEMNQTATRTQFNGISLIASGSSVDRVNAGVYGGQYLTKFAATIEAATYKSTNTLVSGVNTLTAPTGSSAATAVLGLSNDDLVRQNPGQYTFRAIGDQLTISYTGTDNVPKQQTVTVEKADADTGAAKDHIQRINFDKFGVSLTLTTTATANGSGALASDIAASMDGKKFSIIGQASALTNVELTGSAAGSYTFTAGSATTTALTNAIVTGTTVAGSGTQTITFGALNAGESVTVGNQTFTANTAVTGNQVALNFLNSTETGGLMTGSANSTTGYTASVSAGTSVLVYTNNTTVQMAGTGVVGSTVNKTAPSNNLTLTWTDSSSLQHVETVALADASFTAGTDSAITFKDAGVSLKIHNYQAQTGAQVANLIAGLKDPKGGNTGVLNVVNPATSSLDFQSGPGSNSFITINTLNVQTDSTGQFIGTDVPMLNVGSSMTALEGKNNQTSTADWQSAFKTASAAIDSAIDYISTKRSTFGSQMNRLSYVTTNLTAQSTNLQSSKSAIMDTNFASETATLTKGQIMQQAATAMLAQANQMPNVILSLLK